MFEGPAWLVSQYYSITHSYGLAIGLVALTVMILVTPLTLKSTKGMLEMQRLQPEMKRLQAQYRGDRQKLNEEMMKLYQEHKVNPLASCLPLLLQMPVFFIMYRVLRGLSQATSCADQVKNTSQRMVELCTGSGAPKGSFFNPSYISTKSKLFTDLFGQNKMISFGLDLSKSPAHFISTGSIGTGLKYAALVVALGLLYFAQQKMVASRAAVSPTMSATQAKLMQYLPVVFAVFQIFFLTGLVIYYITQAIFRIGQNAYITKRFYHGDDSLGKQAQAAGLKAREEAKAAGDDKGGAPAAGGMFAQAKREAQARREAQDAARKGTPAGRPAGGRPAANRSGRPAPTGRAVPPADKIDKIDKADKAVAPAKSTAPRKNAAPEPAPEPVVSKRVTPPKNRPTPSNNRPQRPTPSGRPGAPKAPKK